MFDASAFELKPMSSAFAAGSYAARHAVWRLLHRHKNDREAPPILILTSRRSGGTWLTDALASEPGLLCVLQPFAIGLSDPFLRSEAAIPQSLRDNLGVPIRPGDESWMRPLMERIFDGRLRIGWPANPFSRRFRFRTNRVLVKMHNTKAWIDWFDESFPNARVVFHLRHPIPQALSTMRMGWPNRTGAYLRDRRFVETHLTPDLESAAHDLSEHGDELQKAIVGWLVENRAPLRLLELGCRRRWLTTTYEESVANPSVVFDRLIKHLGFERRRAVLQSAGLPSHTVFDAAKANLIRNAASEPSGRSALLEGWRERVAQDQLAEAERLFRLFGLRHYRADSPYPSRDLWLSQDSFAAPAGGKQG